MLSQYSMDSFGADHLASYFALFASSWPWMLGHSVAQERRKVKIRNILTVFSRRWSQMRFQQRVQTFVGGGRRSKTSRRGGLEICYSAEALLLEYVPGHP